MGYFSNGTEARAYEAEHCDHCVHRATEEVGSGCPVWGAHLLYNYDECNNDKSILHTLIPRSEDGLRNERCRMFVAEAAAHQQEHTDGE